MEIILKYFADFTDAQLDQFRKLEALYTEWNEKVNVISRKDIASLYEKHVLHSLTIAVLCNFKSGANIVDIGTVGGFPGIPLAIFFPEVKFHLVDSIGKKIRVVNEVEQAIGLQNVTTLHGRVEEIQNRKFDFAVSRAVAPLGELWTWINPLIKKGHKSEEFNNGLICLKGGNLEQEIADSGLKKIVQAWRIQDIFPEPSFEDKFMLYVPKL